MYCDGLGWFGVVGNELMSNWKLINARWGSGDGEVDEVRMDATTHALTTITYPHYELHAGSYYHAMDSTDNLGAETSDTISLLFTTANVAKLAHLAVTAYASGAYRYRLIEGGTGGGAGGSAVTIFNRRRGAGAGTVITAVTKDDTPITGGTTLVQKYIGAGNKVGGDARDQIEWILAPNTQYYVEVYDTSAIVAHLEVEYYEHTDRD